MPAPHGSRVEARRARPEDVERIVALLGALFEQEDEFVASAATQGRGVRSLMADPGRARVLVAELDGRCVAVTTLQVMVSTALGSPVALLEDMVVDRSARGAGVGSVLLVAAIDEAVGLGCRRITLLTDAHNLAAHRFYRRHGFVESSMLPMRLVLDVAHSRDTAAERESPTEAHPSA